MNSHPRAYGPRVRHHLISICQTRRRWDIYNTANNLVIDNCTDLSYVSLKCSLRMTGHQNTVHAFVAPLGSMIVSAASEHSLKLWDIDSGKCVSILVGHHLIYHCGHVLSLQTGWTLFPVLMTQRQNSGMYILLSVEQRLLVIRVMLALSENKTGATKYLYPPIFCIPPIQIFRNI